MRVLARTTMIALSLAVPFSLALARDPVQNVSPAKHPNLAAAQSLIGQAYIKLNTAQDANDRQLSGHAERAKELLAQAADEIKLAAEAANAR